MDITLGQAGIYALLGYAVVFFGLILLMILTSRKRKHLASFFFVPMAVAIAPQSFWRRKIFIFRSGRISMRITPTFNALKQSSFSATKNNKNRIYRAKCLLFFVFFCYNMVKLRKLLKKERK